jgi:hypothetical protein
MRSAMQALAASALVCCFLFAGAPGCGTDAVGVSDCRNIETARCQAAQYCGLIDDVGACTRFYRDQCLHGLPGVLPGEQDVNACVRTIQLAGSCAKSGGKSASLSSCKPAPSAKTIDVTQACQIVTNPERATECSFLGKAPSQDAATESDAEADAPSDAGDGG